MARLVALRVVGVHGVGVVGRHAGSTATSARRRSSAVPPRRLDEPFDHVLEERPAGARCGSTTRPPRDRSGRSSAMCSAGAAAARLRGGRPARHLVVEPPAASSDRSAPSTRRALHVVQRTAPTTSARVEPGALGDPRGELADRRRAGAPHRGEVLLRVEHQPVGVDLAVEVDRRVAAPAPPARRRRRASSIRRRRSRGRRCRGRGRARS